jgi:hypothetical protein
MDSVETLNVQRKQIVFAQQQLLLHRRHQPLLRTKQQHLLQLLRLSATSTVHLIRNARAILFVALPQATLSVVAETHLVQVKLVVLAQLPH